MLNDKTKRLLRFVAFLLVFGVLFVIIQDRVTPEWDWPGDGSRTSSAVSGLYHEPENTLEVLWVGTSHLHNALSPMEVYKRTGIHSYNLATTGQPFLGSYERLKSALERQKPQLVVLDASSCFRSDFWQRNETAWRKMMDSLPWYYFREKFELMRDLVSLNPSTMRKRDIASGLLPLIRYHSNYMLSRNDYLDRHRDIIYFLKGQAVITSTQPVPDNRPGAGGKGDKTDKLIAQLDKQKVTLMKFVELCKQHNCKLMLTKIPVNTAEDYEGYWSEEKHNLISALADELDLPFVDLNFEDVGMDWKTDTCDAGEHVNERGALKVSDFLADWVMEHYSLELSRDSDLNDKWDQQLQVFEFENAKYRFEMEKEPDNYLEYLNDGDYVIFTTVGGRIGDFWTADMQSKLSQVTGTRFDLVDYNTAKTGAYLSVSDSGSLLKEAHGKSKCTAEGVLEDGATYSVFSHDDKSDGKWSVVIDGKEYANQGKGICFVVYDKVLHCVVDSVAFNTAEENKTCKREDSIYLRPMREKMLEYEYEKLNKL